MRLHILIKKVVITILTILCFVISITALTCKPTDDSGDSGDSGDGGDGGNDGEPTVLWSEEYDDTGNEDIAYGIDYDPADNAVYITGYRYVSGVNNLGWKTMKLDAGDGSEIWTEYFDGVELGPDTTYAVTHDSTGVYVVGAIFAAPKPSGSGADMSIKKLDKANGDLIWEADYDSGNNEDGVAYAVTVDPVNSIIYLAGYQKTDENTYDDWWIKAISSSDHSEIWEQFFDAGGGNLNDRAYGIQYDESDNSLYVAGYGFTGKPIDTVVKKLDASNQGAEIWSKTFDKPKASFGHAVDIDSENVYVTGIIIGEPGGSGVPYYDVLVTALSKEDNSEVWEKRMEGTFDYDDFSWGVAVDEPGNAVYSVGYINDNYNDGHPADLLINKIDRTTGDFYNESWDGGLILDGSAGLKDCARAVVVGDDAVYIAGYANLGNGNADWWVISIDK